MPIAPIPNTAHRQLPTLPGRRAIVAASVAALAGLRMRPVQAMPSPAPVRPFRIEVPDKELRDLRQRLSATRWTERETVADGSQGVQLADLQALVRYWGTEYDWRAAEARLNALPQFITEIDGLNIQFAHVRSSYADALPLIMTHGWPGSIIELLKVVGPLTDPVAYGGRAEDAFHLVLPSLPGHGFSGRPMESGWGPGRVGRAWDALMQRLGYRHYVSQGGDHGSVVSHAMARQGLPGLVGIHVNMPATVPRDIARRLRAGDHAPDGLSPVEGRAFGQLEAFYRTGAAYAALMTTRPQTLGAALADSPAGLAAFFYEKFAAWTDSGGQPGSEAERGGHFAAWEQPGLFASELRAAFRSFR